MRNTLTRIFIHLFDRSIQGRPKWNVVDFVREFNLGDPIGGNFFQAKYDEYVPVLHAQMHGQ